MFTLLFSLALDAIIFCSSLLSHAALLCFCVSLVDLNWKLAILNKVSDSF